MRTGNEIKKVFKPLLLPNERAIVIVMSSSVSEVNASIYTDEFTKEEILQVIRHLNQMIEPNILSKPISIN